MTVFGSPGFRQAFTVTVFGSPSFRQAFTVTVFGSPKEKGAINPNVYGYDKKNREHPLLGMPPNEKIKEIIIYFSTNRAGCNIRERRLALRSLGTLLRVYRLAQDICAALRCFQ